MALPGAPDLLALDEALRALAVLDAERARIVELRFFGGLSDREIGVVLGLSEVTVSRRWRGARAWLNQHMASSGSGEQRPSGSEELGRATRPERRRSTAGAAPGAPARARGTRSGRSGVLVLAAAACWAVAAGAAAPARVRVDAYPEAEIARHLARGKELHDAFDYAAAAREFEQAHGLAPGQFDALSWLCHVYNDLGHRAPRAEAESFYAQAAEHAQALRQGHPGRAQGYFWVAASYGNLALFKGGRDKVRLARDVEANARKAIAIEPGYAPPYVALGMFYREVAELGFVLRAFAKVLYGGLPKATHADSEAALRKAVELDPQGIFPRYQLGLTLLRRDRDADAARELRALLALPVAEAEDLENQADARARLARIEGRR